jgi:hypothetical protein
MPVSLRRREEMKLPLTTPRLLLRRFRTEDLPSFSHYRNLPEVARFQSWTHYGMTEATAFYEQQRSQAFAEDESWFQLAVEIQANGALEGVAMMLWLACREDPLLFVLLSGVVFFGWGEIFSLFPSTLTDTFGSEHAASNYGWLYISQGIGSIFGGPLAALLYQHTHGWHVVFSCAIGLDFVTAALALWVLKPWRARFIRQHS